MFMLKLGRVQSNRLAILVSLPAAAVGRSASRWTFSGGPTSSLWHWAHVIIVSYHGKEEFPATAREIGHEA